MPDKGQKANAALAPPPRPQAPRLVAPGQPRRLLGQHTLPPRPPPPRLPRALPLDPWTSLAREAASTSSSRLPNANDASKGDSASIAEKPDTRVVSAGPGPTQAQGYTEWPPSRLLPTI